MTGKKARAKERKGLGEKMERKTEFTKQFGSFELKTTPDKGIGAFATSAMAAGTSFFKETPVIQFDMPFELISELDLAKAYKRLSAADKILFDQARHDTDHAPNCKCLRGTASANSFGSPPKIYPIGSRFNHSCDPNTMMLSPLKGTHQTFRTLKAVSFGEELTFNYSTSFDFLTTAQRELELSDDRWEFQCLCSHCQRPPAQVLVSDMRRVLLRHLHFWLRKKDIADTYEVQPNPALSKTVPDPKLLKAGVYTLLYAMLHEAEGIVSGGDAYLSYSYTVLHVLNVAYHYKVMRISPGVVQDMRMWMRKAEDNVRLQYGNLAEGESGFQAIREAMSHVPDDGELDWVELLRFAAKRAKMGELFFSRVAP